MSRGRLRHPGRRTHFYYGSKVRSVPEFMRMRFGTGAHLVNSISFAVAQLLIAGQFSNLMDDLQTLFGLFNAPLFATFILGMFWRRMTPTAGWTGLAVGTLSAVALWGSSTSLGVFTLPGQGLVFVSAATAFVVDIVDPDEKNLAFFRRPAPMATIGLTLVIIFA